MHVYVCKCVRLQVRVNHEVWRGLEDVVLAQLLQGEVEHLRTDTQTHGQTNTGDRPSREGKGEGRMEERGRRRTIHCISELSPTLKALFWPATSSLLLPRAVRHSSFVESATVTSRHTTPVRHHHHRGEERQGTWGEPEGDGESVLG